MSEQERKELQEKLTEWLEETGVDVTEDKITEACNDRAVLEDIKDNLCAIRDSYQEKVKVVNLSVIVNFIALIVVWTVSSLTGLLLILANWLALFIARKVINKRIEKCKQHLRDIGFPIPDAIEGRGV